MAQMRSRSQVRRSLIVYRIPRGVRAPRSNACLPTRPCSGRARVGPSRARRFSSTAVWRPGMRSQLRAGALATGPGNARFVSVVVRPVTLPTILPAAFFGGANTITTSAFAVAGFDQVVCGITPIYVCNPYETPGMTHDQATEALQRAAANPADQARLVRLRQYDGNAPYAAADYGFLTSPTLGSDDASLIDSVAVVRPAACFLQRGVNFRPGVVQSVREGFNVRFDIYEGLMSDKYNDSNYQPAQNVRKGYVVASGAANQNACTTRRGANWPIGSPPDQVTGLPLDRTWPNFGRMG